MGADGPAVSLRRSGRMITPSLRVISCAPVRPAGYPKSARASRPQVERSTSVYRAHRPFLGHVITSMGPTTATTVSRSRGTGSSSERLRNGAGTVATSHTTPRMTGDRACHPVAAVLTCLGQERGSRSATGNSQASGRQ